jgi:glucose dehydrogenase
VFVSGGARTLSAFHSETGELLWEGRLQERGSANPMTYATGDGRQFVVVAVGSGENAALVAFSLPSS